MTVDASEYAWAVLGVFVVLPGCGGGDAAPEPSRHERAQIALMREAAGNESPAYACLRKATMTLMNAHAREGPSIDCLAGAYGGNDGRGSMCLLTVAASGGKFRFQMNGAALHIAPDQQRDGSHEPAAHAIERADVETGQIGLRLSRTDAATAATESIVIAGGQQTSGRAELASLTYEQVRDGQVRIARCHFDH